jgi:hypothetical protein
VKRLGFAASVLAVFALLAAPPPATVAQETVSFGVPRVVDPIHLYGEPDVKVAPNGDVHVSGPAGTGTQRAIWNISVDGGDSWRAVQAVPFASTSPAIPNKADLGPGGGDTEIAFDHSGKAYFSDLWALTCYTAATTADRGATISSQPAGCAFPGGDRQWMAVFDPPPGTATNGPWATSHPGKPLIYQEYDNLTTGNRVDMSTDGLVWTKAGEYAIDLNQVSPAQRTNNGNIVVDQLTGSLLGLMATTSPNAGHEGLSLAVGQMQADGTQTNFTNHLVADVPGSPEVLFPVLAMDKARNAYAVYSVNCAQGKPLADPCFHIFYSYASAATGWSVWSAPRRVDTLKTNQSSLMPYVAAGGAGNVDIVWYGTDQRVHPSDQKNQNWDVYLAELRSADSASPTSVVAKASPHPMKHNDICITGTACITNQPPGNRNLADFFEVAIDTEGRARIVYSDTSNELMQNGGIPHQVDHPGGPLVTVATQSTGRNAWTGAPLPPKESAAPVAGVTDPVGDALWKPLGGMNLPGLDIVDTALSLQGDTLHVKVTTKGDSIGAAAQSANALFGQLVVRWQYGNDLYYAAVEQDAAKAHTVWYAGQTTSVDLCSVSACDPHYLTYAAPPAGGVAVQGTTRPVPGGGVTYDIAVPTSAIGKMTSSSLLEEVMGFSTVSATPAELPLTNAQALTDVVPIQVEGTRTFNYSARAVGQSNDERGNNAQVFAATANRTLPATGLDLGRVLALGGILGGLSALALVVRRRVRTG